MVLKTPNDANQLIPNRYPQGDLFICDVSDAILKGILQDMEHPFYALSKKPDTQIRKYEHNGNWLEITPSVKGLATIYDKDILIYCISQIMHKKNNGEDVSKRVRINTHDLLIFTNRGTAGKDYNAICEAVSRLGGVQISTNIKSGDEEQFDVFGLIDSSSIRRKHGMNGRLLWCDITLSDWVFNAIEANEVLTLHRDYFRLRKPLERRIYELARKHCGQQPSWDISLHLLLKKTGSQSSIKKFRQMLKHVVLHDHLPDYHVAYDVDTDIVTFTNRNTMLLKRDKAWDGTLSTTVMERVSKLNLKTDKYVLEHEWRSWIASKDITPDNPDGHFYAFCKNRASQSYKH